MAGHQPNRGPQGLRARSPVTWVAWGLAILGGVIVYAGLVEPYRVRFEEVEIALPQLPGSLDGLRILHLSDLESTGVGRRERQVAAIGERARADLVVMTGDLVAKSLEGAARESATAEAAAVLAGLPSRLGSYFVEGHGERVALAARRQTEEALAAVGVTYLKDEVVTFPVGGSAVSIVGLGLHSVTQGPGFERDGEILFQEGTSLTGAYFNLAMPDAERLQDYTVRGELRFSSERSGIGITFYSQMPAGRDAFYRLRRTPAKKEMHLSPHGTVFSEGRTAYSTVTRPGRWYGFEIEAKTELEGTRVRARVWAVDEEEPPEWRIDCLDATPTRLTGGTLGLWSGGPGRKEFRRLMLEAGGRVIPLGGSSAEGVPWKPPRAPDFILAVAERIPEGSFPIVLSHSPDIFPMAAEMGWPLVLAGHTQGGQIRLPFIGALTTDSTLGRGYASGLFSRGGSWLYITRGIGTTRVPFRFLVPPEVALITLRATAPGAAGAEAAP